MSTGTTTRQPATRQPAVRRLIARQSTPGALAARQLTIGVLRRLANGSLTLIEPDGRRLTFGSGQPSGTLQLRSDRVWTAFLHGSRGLAEAYFDELWDSPDLAALVAVGAANIAALDRFRRPLIPLRWPLELVREWRGEHGLARSRHDISTHYDLGNELFMRMLDPAMIYSAAYFEHPDATLAAAQQAKLELVCSQLAIGPEDHVLEIGTGWGGFAIHAAASRGCRVTTTTISAQQHAYATAAVAAAGLSDRVTVLQRDYRELRGHYDKLVCIEMIEAVGWRNLGRFLRCCSELLADDGAMLLQAITVDDRAYRLERSSRTFITEHIFPGGSLPSLAALTTALAGHTDLQLAALRDLTDHYVKTLRHWRVRFLAAAEELAEFGYDARFQRIWRLYLAYSEAGFAQRRIADSQLLLLKPRYSSRPRAWA